MIACGRTSSELGEDDFVRMLRAVPITEARYEALLSGGELGHVPEGQDPADIVRKVSRRHPAVWS